MKRIVKMIFALWPFYLIGIVLVGILWAVSQPPATTISTGAPSPPPVKKEPTEKDKRLTNAIAGAMVLKDAMRNPESFKIRHASMMDNGAVCYEYTSQNGFGGMNREYAVLPHNMAGVLIPDMKGYRSSWTKECTGKSGEEIGDYLNIALK